MGRERRWLGCLGAAFGALPAAPLAWLLTRSDISLALAGLGGFLLSMGGYRLAAGRSSGFGICLAALFTPLAALPGLYCGYGELILRDNARYGCTLAEALELVPVVALDPINRVMLLWDLGGLVLLDLLTAVLFARYRRLRELEKP